MKTNARPLMLAGLLAASFLFAAQARAESEWQKEHPRREEVNQRLHHQDRRIHRELKEGKISRDEARKLHREDRDIRQQEQGMAKLDHGHITKQEQKTLNQEENQVSQQIKNGN